MGLLTQAQPVAMSSHVMLPEPVTAAGSSSKHSYANDPVSDALVPYAEQVDPFMAEPVQPLTAEPSTSMAMSSDLSLSSIKVPSSTKSPRKMNRRSRALPAPPIAAYSDRGYNDGVGYSDPFAPPLDDMDHINNSAPPVASRQRSSRSSRGYVPLPEPPVSNQARYSDGAGGYERASYYDGALSYYDSHPQGTDKTGEWRQSQTSQLSRVDSVGAGDHRRHSRRGRGTGRRHQSTAERIRALRSATADTDASVPSKYSNEQQAASYAYDTQLDMDQYPVREEYRYQSQPQNFNWNQGRSTGQARTQGYGEQYYQGY